MSRKTSVLIRQETDRDRASIRAVTRAAFTASAHGLNGEDTLVDALRAAGALTISLVAEEASTTIVGHVAVSPITVNGRAGRWFALGPLAVLPNRQRHGIGHALVDAVITRLLALNAAGCVLLGEPAYYARFGFRHDPDLTLPGYPAEYFQTLRLADETEIGLVSYHPAFFSGHTE